MKSHPVGTELDVPVFTSVSKFCVYALPMAVRLIDPAAEVVRTRMPIAAIVKTTIRQAAVIQLALRCDGEEKALMALMGLMRLIRLLLMLLTRMGACLIRGYSFTVAPVNS